MQKLVVGAIAVAVIFALAVTGALLTQTKIAPPVPTSSSIAPSAGAGQPGPATSSTVPPTNRSASSSTAPCGTNYPIFNVPLFSPNAVTSVLPLADFFPPDHVFPTPHAYIYTTNPYKNISKDGAYFYAPGNMTLTAIAIRNLRNTQGVYKNYTDYTLVFQSCKDFYLYFHNVVSLLYPPFINASMQLRSKCGDQIFCQGSADIKIAAGEPIGTIGNSSAGIQGLDVGARDYRLPAGRSAFVDPGRLCPLDSGHPNVFDRCYTVCPYSYFTKQIQDTIHFSSVDGNVTGASCGTVYQDINETAKGYWFNANGSTSAISPEATYLFLGDDNLKPSLGVFSIGTSFPNVQAGKYVFTKLQSGLFDRDFGNVTPGNTYCYQANSLSGSTYDVYGPPVVIALRLANSTTLDIGKLNATSCGNGPWTIGSRPTAFVR